MLKRVQKREALLEQWRQGSDPLPPLSDDEPPRKSRRRGSGSIAGRNPDLPPARHRPIGKDYHVLTLRLMKEEFEHLQAARKKIEVSVRRQVTYAEIIRDEICKL